MGLALIAAFFLALPSERSRVTPDLVVPHNTFPTHSQWQFDFASDAKTELVHAASMVELPDGRIRGFWFAGSYEGAPDVSINSAVFDPQTGTWSPEKTVVTRKWIVQQWGRHVRQLGNMTPVIDADGRMRLYVVAVSLGGWAGSRVVALHSNDLGATWHFDRVLKTTPFLNISTLVKTPPVHYKDGTIGLPVYHELVGKFGELLRLDKHNRILDMSRIGYGRVAIQPLVLVTGPQSLVAFLRPERDGERRLYVSHSQNGGADWTPIHMESLVNASSAVGGIALSPDHWAVVTNCNKEARDDLCIRQTRDAGQHWDKTEIFRDKSKWRDDAPSWQKYRAILSKVLKRTDTSLDVQKVLKHARHNMCEKGKGCDFQFDYPYMIQTRNGDIHILYTWNKTLIRHAWLRADATEVSQ